MSQFSIKLQPVINCESATLNECAAADAADAAQNGEARRGRVGTTPTAISDRFKCTRGVISEEKEAAFIFINRTEKWIVRFLESRDSFGRQPSNQSSFWWILEN